RASTCIRWSVWLAATSRDQACSTTAPRERSAGSPCRPVSRTAPVCRRPSSRQPPRPPWVTTTRTSYAAVERTVGAERAAELRDLTLRIYSRAEEIARERGIILADTKFEFGARADGTTVLGDEVLTPDSSRFWSASQWSPGRTQPSYDKDKVRNWLTSAASGWDKASGAPPPALPDEVVEMTRAKYVEAYERLTGTTF